MTVHIPPAIVDTLKDRASRLHLSVDEIVEQALAWYVAIDPELLEDFAAIEDAHAEALRMIDEAAEPTT
jgi:hypothetical protein